MNFDILWEQAKKQYLQNNMGDSSYTAWIKTMVPLEMRNNEFYFEVPTSINKQYLMRYIDNITESLSEISGKEAEVHILIKDEYDINTLKPKNNDISYVKPSDKSGLIERFNFDNFIVGASNNLAYSAGLAVVESPGDGYNPLFLYGGVGLGKTHLMNAIGNEISKKYPDFKILYLSCEKFTNELITAIHDKKTDEFREKYRRNTVYIKENTDTGRIFPYL